MTTCRNKFNTVLQELSNALGNGINQPTILVVLEHHELVIQTAIFKMNNRVSLGDWHGETLDDIEHYIHCLQFVLNLLSNLIEKLYLVNNNELYIGYLLRKLRYFLNEHRDLNFDRNNTQF